MVLPTQRRGPRPIEYLVSVNPAGGAVSGVEIRRHMVDGLDSDVRRQVIIQGPEEGFRWVRTFGEEVNYLALGMGSGVGAAGTPHPEGFTGEPAQGGLQGFLHRRMLGLPLESHIGATVVLDHQSQPPTGF